MTKNLTSDQKLDLILEKVTTLEKNQNDLIKTAGEVALLSGKTADKLETLFIEVSDIKDEQELQSKKLDNLTGSFSPFKSGVFVA